MQDLELKVLGTLCQWLTQGVPAWLCTVLETYGSSPRPPGALLAVNAAGETAGSLSGGCIEEDMLARLVGGELDSASNVMSYGGAGKEGERWGLPCGGQMHVHIKALEASDASRYADVVLRLRRRERVLRHVLLRSGLEAFSAAPGMSPSISVQHDRFSQVLGPVVRLLLIGANPVSAYTAEFAGALGYEVILCDPDASRVNDWRGPDVTVSTLMPDDAVREWASDGDSAVLALSHDPRLDDMALMEALQGPAFYIGAMGSLRTSTRRRERLHALDLSQEQIDRLIAPIGLDIGSKTPAEIALAVVGDIVRHIRLRPHPDERV